jgi:hypothetical protein
VSMEKRPAAPCGEPAPERSLLCRRDLSAASAAYGSLWLIHGERLQVLFFEVAGFLYCSLPRDQYPHLSLCHRLGVGFDQPNFTREAVHLVSCIDGTARRGDRIHAADDEGE